MWSGKVIGVFKIWILTSGLNSINGRKRASLIFTNSSSLRKIIIVGENELAIVPIVLLSFFLSFSLLLSFDEREWEEKKQEITHSSSSHFFSAFFFYLDRAHSTRFLSLYSLIIGDYRHFQSSSKRFIDTLSDLSWLNDNSEMNCTEVFQRKNYSFTMLNQAFNDDSGSWWWWTNVIGKYRLCRSVSFAHIWRPVKYADSSTAVILMNIWSLASGSLSRNGEFSQKQCMMIALVISKTASAIARLTSSLMVHRGIYAKVSVFTQTMNRINLNWRVLFFFK